MANYKKKSIVGQKFGRLTAIREDTERTGANDYRWVFSCDCGVEKSLRRNNVVSGKTTSCGCARFKTHGKSKTPEYHVWASMICRCSVKHIGKEYTENYAARGIEVCERWLSSFEDFLEDMGQRPAPGYQIDRINNDGNYEPGNCRWVTVSENARNKRNNRRITFQGKSQSIKKWANDLGMSYRCLEGRIARGWSTERAFTQPVGHRREKSTA